jgi:isopenicillin N synthase-like dioxygenase
MSRFLHPDSEFECTIVLQIMSNGIFKSPVHRVVTNTEKERISLTVFYGVGAENVLEPAAGLLDEKRPARYRKVDMMDFIAGVHEQFSRGTRFIESLISNLGQSVSK